MLISCPSCSTSYDVDAAGLGAQGRTVRCSNCGHKWHQVPVAAAPPPPPPPPPNYAAPPPAYGQPPAPGYPPQYQQPYYPPQGYGPPPGQEQPVAQPPQPAPPPAEAEAATPPSPPEPEEPVAAPPPPPAPETEQVDPEDLPTDEELDAMLGPEEEPESGSLTPEFEEDLTEIDEEALAALEDPEPLEDFSAGEGDGDIEEVDPDDIPDPDPIPGGISGEDDFEDDEDGKRGGRGKMFWILVGTGGFFLLLIILLFAAPRMMSAIPGLGALYSMVGVNTDDLGEGLNIEVLKQARELIKDEEVLVVTGRIENVSEKPRAVPIIRVSLHDINDRRVQFLDIMPSKKELPPGEKIDFKGEVRNMIPTARRLEVGWSESDAVHTPEEPIAEEPASDKK